VASLRGLLRRHVGVVLALLVLPLSALFAFGQPLRPRAVLPELDGRIVEFSPDGRKLLTDGASGGCVRDAATGRILARLLRKDNTRATDITWPRFTPDGKRLIVQIGGTRFGNHQTRTVALAVFDAKTGREMAAFEPVGADAWNHFGPEYALSADGSTLAFVPKPDYSRGGRIVVWDVDAGKTLAEFQGLPPLALSMDGGMIVHGDVDHNCVQPRISVLKADRPARSGRPRFPKMRSVNYGPLTFSHDDSKLTTLLRSPRPPHVGPPLTLDVSEVVRMAVAPDDNAATSRDGPRIIHFGPSGMLGVYLTNAICLGPDAKLLFVGIPFNSVGEPMTQVWGVAGQTPSLAMECHTAAVAPDAGRAVTARYDMASRWDPGSYDNSDVKVFDLPSPTPRLEFKETGVHVAAISPDGKLLALPSHRWGVTGSTLLSRVIVSAYGAFGFGLNGFAPSLEIHEVRLYNAATGRFLRAFPLRKARAYPLVEFSSDSRTLVERYFAPTYVNSTGRPMNDWSVELWDVPAGLADGFSSGTLFILAAAALVLAGAAFDWRRGG
jgi:WD40-like Beta Propeller Repeat